MSRHLGGILWNFKSRHLAVFRRVDMSRQLDACVRLVKSCHL